jgi:hypothetical protein
MKVRFKDEIWGKLSNSPKGMAIVCGSILYFNDATPDREFEVSGKHYENGFGDIYITKISWGVDWYKVRFCDVDIVQEHILPEELFEI